jgi:DNA-binding transcriptional regulator YiaG
MQKAEASVFANSGFSRICFMVSGCAIGEKERTNHDALPEFFFGGPDPTLLPGDGRKHICLHGSLNMKYDLSAAFMNTAGLPRKHKTLRKSSMYNPISQIIGANLKALRTSRHLSQQRVATFLNITFQQYQKYENGKNTISAPKIFMLANFYNCRTDDFFVPHPNCLNL